MKKRKLPGPDDEGYDPYDFDQHEAAEKDQGMFPRFNPIFFPDFRLKVET